MSARDLPDVHGHFDAFGGRFVPEALQAALNQLEKTFEAALADPDFHAELDALRRDYAGRPSPLTEAPPVLRARGRADRPQGAGPAQA